MSRRGIEELWTAHRRAGGVDEGDSDGDYDTFAFGDSPAMADALADLVLLGPKRATAGLLADHERDGDPLPRAGGHAVVLDGRGAPVCVIRTTRVEVKPLARADVAFAWDEGEGDRTLAWWLDAHRRCFARRCVALGIPFSDDLPTEFERFALVWPPPADPA